MSAEIFSIKEWKYRHEGENGFLLPAQRGGMFLVVSVYGSMGVWCICQRGNSWTVSDIIMKYLWEQDMVRSSDEFKQVALLLQRGRAMLCVCQ